MDTQTQIDRLIELAIVQRAELKKLVSELPQLREHLNAEIERVFESTEPQLRTELEDWTTKQAHDQTVKLGGELEAKIVALSKSLEATTQTRYNAIMAERAQNIDLAKKAEDKLAEVAQAIPVQVKQIVTDELARFPRAGEIDQLRKEFAEPRGLNPRGRWEPGATYYKLDLVAYNGDSYVANEETSEKPNRTSSKWTLNAARGQAGGGGFMSPAIGDYTASMITNVPAGVITSTNVQDAINELAADVDVSQNTLDALVTNADSVTITKGQVVYAFGSVGNRMSVKLALNTGDATSSKTIGVVLDSSIAAGAIGNIRCVGVVDGLTLGSYTEGDVLYLGATAGSVTATKPYAPNHLVYVGIVERANNGNGELYVKIQNGYELDEIHDVQITSAPLAGALLMRDATNSLWKANRLTGTTNQVTVTNADTAVTLSLPTSLASVDSITASGSTALTLTGGSTGASLVLGSGSNGAQLAMPGNGILAVSNTNNGAYGTIATFLGPSIASGSSALLALGKAASSNQAAFINYGYNTTAASTFLDFGHYGTTGQVRLTQPGNLLIGTTTDITGSGGLKIAGTTDATLGTLASGAFQLSGGASVTGKLNVGLDARFGTSTDYAQLTTSGGVPTLLLRHTNTDRVSITANGDSTFNGGDVRIGNTNTALKLFVAGTAAATTTTSGALIVAGGVGVSGAGYFGGNINTATAKVIGADNLNFTTDTTQSYFFGIARSGDTANRFNGLKVYNNANGNAGAPASRLGFYTDKTGITAGTEWMTLNENGNLNIATTTPASSSTVGALTIGNGTAATNVAIGGGKIWAGSTEASTGSTSGSGIFAGGIYAGAASVFGGTLTGSGGIAAGTLANSVITGYDANAKLRVAGNITIDGAGRDANGATVDLVAAHGTAGGVGPWMRSIVTSYANAATFDTSTILYTKSAATTSAVLTLDSSKSAIFAGVVIKKNYTVATLPAAASYTYGEAYVSDATQAAGTSLGSAPTGGGSVKRGVYSDGSSWLLR